MSSTTKNCAIVGCKNSKENAPEKQFFFAPRNKEIRGLWIYATGRNYKESTNFIVCEDHFDLSTDLDTEILRTDGRKALKKDVMPHFKLEGKGQSSAGRSSTSVNVFAVDKECQTDFVPEWSSGVKRKTMDSSTNTGGSTSNPETTPSNPEDHSSKEYVPDYNELLSEEENCDTESEEQNESENDSASEDEVEDEECSFEAVNEKKIMCELTIKFMKKKIQHYTGIPPASAYIVDLIVERNLMSERNLFLVLRKIRHDETFEILGDLFGVTRQHAGKIFSECIAILAFHLKPFIFWPSLIDVKLNLPLQFKHKFKNVESLLDCLESEMKKPHHPVPHHQALSWSNYKHCNTIKHLLSGTPDGLINFKSQGYTGRISDIEIVKRSGYMINIKDKTEAMADRGFKELKSVFEEKGAVLHKPPSTQAGTRFTKEEAKLCKSVAATRVHIERVIGKLRDFALLKPHKASVHSKRTYLLEHAFTVGAAICNMQGYLIKI